MRRHCSTNNRATTVDIHGPLQTGGETRCPGGVSEETEEMYFNS